LNLDSEIRKAGKQEEDQQKALFLLSCLPNGILSFRDFWEAMPGEQ
jgi:hypothetical protein